MVCYFYSYLLYFVLLLNNQLFVKTVIIAFLVVNQDHDLIYLLSFVLIWKDLLYKIKLILILC